MKFFTLVFIIFGSTTCISQQIITGTIDNWNNEETNVLMMTSFDEAETIGSIDSLGTFKIEMDGSIVEKIRQTKNEQPEENASGWKKHIPTIKETFGCNNNDSLKITNGSITFHKFTFFMGSLALGNFEEKKMYGSFSAASSRAFLDAYTSLDKRNAEVGYILDWYYVDEPASIIGTCTVKFLLPGESVQKTEIKNLEFKTGWNMVKISSNEIYTDKEGKTYTTKWTYETIDSFPEDVQFVYSGK